VTYVTNHQPMPQPTGEFGQSPALLWIPERGGPLAVAATFRADPAPGGCRLTLQLLLDEPGLSASVFRSSSDEFETRERLTAEPIALSGAEFTYLDQAVEPGRTYYYWVQLHRSGGGSIWMGPVAASFARATFAAAARPNPVSSRTRFEYAIGSDIAAGGPVSVSLTLHDLQGRLVRTLRSAREGMGQYGVDWDATDNHGRPVDAGVYYLLFRAGGAAQRGKVTVVR
jgi:hypothetical protein